MSPSRRPRRGSRLPPRVLLNTTAVVGVHDNKTTARDVTRNGNTIKVSFLFKRPPQPSTLFVHSSDLNLSYPPDIVCSVDDLLLLCVNMGCGRSNISPEDCDYFIYRADSRRPSLELLQRPHPFFHDCDVGLLPRLDGLYTVAALIATITLHQYELHLFHSDTSSWSSSMVSAEALQKEFPVKIPRYCTRLLYHLTTTVVTIGGERGTMGWVDLWHGILLCDVLDPKPSLRGVPLPLPLTEMSYNNGLGIELGFPGQRRGIAYISDRNSLRDRNRLILVHLEITGVRLPDEDEETGSISFRVDDWALTTWSNNKLSNSLEDWRKECRIQASNITIDPAISRVLEDSGLLHRPWYSGKQRDLQNLSMYQPFPCWSGEDVVYLVAREKFMHPKAWILAIDMNNGKLQGVAYIGEPEYNCRSIICQPSRISRYMNQAKYINPATTSAGKDAEESNDQASAVELDYDSMMRVASCQG